MDKVSKIGFMRTREIELMVDDILSVRHKVAPRVEELTHGQIVGISLSKYQKKLYKNSMNELRKRWA